MPGGSWISGRVKQPVPSGAAALRAPGVALLGALAAAVIGLVVAREGAPIAVGGLAAIGLICFVQARPLNGLIAGIAIVVVVPYWYSKGGVTVLQLGIGLAVLSLAMARVLQGAAMRWTLVDVAVIGLLLAAVLDWYLRGGNFAAARATANTVLPLLFYFAARMVRPGDRRVVLWTLVGAAALAALSLFYEFDRGQSAFIDPNSYYWIGKSGHSIFRPGGVFGSPPAAVTGLAMAALVGFALLGEVAPRRRNLVRVALTVIVAGGVITFTRAGWIGFGVGALVYLVVLRLRGGLRLPRWVRLVPLAAVAVILAIPVLSQMSWFQLGVDRGGTLSVRQSYWKLAGGLIADSPQHLLIGRGLNSFVVGTRPELGGLQEPIAAAPHLISAGTHNQYVRTLLEQGLVGLALMLLWLGGAVALAARRVARLPNSDRRLVAGITAALACFLVISFVDNTLRDPNSVAAVSLLTGVLVSICVPVRSAVGRRPGS